MLGVNKVYRGSTLVFGKQVYENDLLHKKQDWLDH